MKLKLDHLMPTGSFKDRGAKVLISALKKLGIEEVVEDSSGNAGAAIAAYCAAAGIDCQIYVPESASGSKLKQIQAYGAEVVKVPGDRDDTSRAVKKACKNNYYASHIYNPLFFEGTKTIAHEIYQQIGIPKTMVIPAGNGTLLLGVYKGFYELGNLPKIIAVQSERCAPLTQESDDTTVSASSNPTGDTIAKGIAAKNPPRKLEMLKAISDSRGQVLTVSEDEIKSSRQALWNKGIFVETTAAVAVAGAIKLFDATSSFESTGTLKTDMQDVLVPLTGTGLKEF
ncbi:pyridoxal-phosphate dependent enzyme [Natranaerobius thermophilus]|uniref:pyridoxal-phosphate dependent enzyme n=1 Tax=Natranaerobius thermophilus TaxID=375929 RepID=UPI002F408077